MIHDLPYTDMHELNLDWFLAEFKKYYEHITEQDQKITTMEQTVEQFTTFVTNYFDNLDVQQEINNKLDAMAASGELQAMLQPYFDHFVESVDDQITTQNQRLDTLTARMDEFASLPDGSTAGDAELLDIRVGYNGKTYTSAGNAVRGQVTDLHNSLSPALDAISKNPTVYSKTNTYYADVTPFTVGHYYVIDITSGTTGTYTLKSGPIQDNASMVDTLYNGTLTANVPVRILYTPSVAGLKVLRMSANNITWSASIAEFIDIKDLVNTVSLLDGRVDSTDHLVNNINNIQNTVNNIICIEEGSVIPQSAPENFKINTAGVAVSASGYTIYKYHVTAGSLLKISALKTDEADNIMITFRSTDSVATALNIIDKWEDGLDQVTVVPEGVLHLMISVKTTTIPVVKNVTLSIESEIGDGSVSYSSLDDFLQGKIDEIGSIVTPTGTGTFTSIDDIPTLDVELLDSEGWTGEGWTGDFVNGFTHVSGTDPLERTIAGLIPGGMYRFTITTSNAKTNGYSDFYVSLGGSATFETYRGGGASVSYVYGLIAAGDNNKLQITPSNWNGTITGLSLRRVTNAQLPAIIIKDESGNIKAADILTGASGRTSIYFGKGSGQKGFFADANAAFGVNALKNVTDGFWNTAIGMNAMEDNIHGTRNIAIGYIALQHCIGGDRNIAIGTFALNSLTSGRGNIAIGADAMQGANGEYAIGIGVGACGGGNESIGIGHRALHGPGQKNTVVGAFAMENIGSGEFNVASGYQAAQNSTGKYNTCVGAMAGKYGTTGNNNILIGYNAQKETNTDSNTTVIGNSDIVKTKVYGDLIVEGTDHVKRKIVFNVDNTCSWEAIT